MPKSSARPTPHSEEGRSLTLFELTGAYAQLASLLDADPEAGPDIEGALNQVEGAIKAKAESIAMVIRQKEAEIQWIDRQVEIYREEVTRLANRVKARQGNVDRVKRWLHDQLAILGEETQKVEGSTLNVTLSKRPEYDDLVVIDESTVPQEFKKADLTIPATEVTPELAQYVKEVKLDKRGLNEHFKRTGVAPTGTEPVPGRRTLKIY